MIGDLVTGVVAGFAGYHAAQIAHERKSRPLSYPGAYKSLFYEETRNDDRWSAQIKVDIDTARNPFRMRAVQRAGAFLRRSRLEIKRVEVYSTRKGFHVRVWVAGTFTHATILRAQLLFGDDPVRCMFNAKRVARGEAGWNVLWTSKHRNGRLISQETIDDAAKFQCARVQRWLTTNRG